MSGIDKGFLFGILTEVLRGNKRPTFSHPVRLKARMNLNFHNSIVNGDRKVRNGL